MGKPSLVLILTLSVFIIFLSGCAQSPGGENESAVGNSETSPASYEQTLIDACIQACENAKARGTNLENGPCLLNPMPQNNSWVCDVAHDPRQDIDNLIENRCSSFGKGETKHFIEVNPDCIFIKKF